MDDPARAAGGALGNYAVQTRRERPMSDVFRDIFGNVQEMVRSEVRLVRAELKEEAREAAKASIVLGVGVALGLYAAGFLLVCADQLLALVMPGWAATLVLGLTLAIAASILISKGRKRFRIPAPDRAIESVKENVEWMKSQTKS